MKKTTQSVWSCLSAGEACVCVCVWGRTVRMIQYVLDVDSLQVNASKPLGRSGCTRVIYYYTSRFKLHSTPSIDTCQREQSANASAASESRELPLKHETRATRDACDPSTTPTPATYCTSSVIARIQTVKLHREPFRVHPPVFTLFVFVEGVWNFTRNHYIMHNSL